MQHILDLDITQLESTVLMLWYLNYKFHIWNGFFVCTMEVLVEGYAVKVVVTKYI
jgi:hypothetical protein